MYIKKFILVILNSFFLLASCSQFGENPSGDHLDKIKKSPNYNTEEERFENRIENMWDQMSEKDSFWANPKKGSSIIIFSTLHKQFLKLNCQRLNLQT